MKNTVIVLSLACLITACGNTKTTKQTATDSTKVDTLTENKTANKDEKLDAGFVETEIPALFINDTFGVEMAYYMAEVEAGTFTMGAAPEEKNASEEQPAHKVTLTKNFYIGTTEVTQKMWLAVMGYNPSEFPEHDYDEDRPVERVAWEAVQKFIKKLNAATGKNFRLPTEAEWEFAARGGNKSKHYIYSGSNNVDEVAWYDWGEDNYDGTFRMFENVSMKKPNELGLYDMSGNVAEWCQDWYGDYTSSPQTDPKGPATGEYRVVRSGGGTPNGCRITTRNGSEPAQTMSGYECTGTGFRLVLTK